MSNQLAQLDKSKELIASASLDFMRVCADTSINFEREAGFAIQLLQGNSYLLETAYANPESLRSAVINVAAIGISLNPAKKQAYLVPRKNANSQRAVCLDISYMGLLHLAQISGAIYWGKADVVRANDVFEITGLDSPPIHRFNPFATATDRGEIIGAYVVVKTTDGDYLTHTMQVDDINSIRDRSESWKAGGKGPWKSDYQEMAKKTAVKQAHKYWPHRDRLQQAIHHLDTDGGEGLEFDVTPPATATQIAEQARKRAPVTMTEDERNLLVNDLTAKASEGNLAAWDDMWASFTSEQRAAVTRAKALEIRATVVATDTEVVNE